MLKYYLTIICVSLITTGCSDEADKTTVNTLFGSEEVSDTKEPAISPSSMSGTLSDLSDSIKEKTSEVTTEATDKVAETTKEVVTEKVGDMPIVNDTIDTVKQKVVDTIAPVVEPEVPVDTVVEPEVPVDTVVEPEVPVDTVVEPEVPVDTPEVSELNVEIVTTPDANDEFEK